MSQHRRRLITMFSVLTAATIGIVTNLITDSFTWTLALSLAFLLILSITFAWLGDKQPTPSQMPTVTQQAKSGGRIESGEIRIKNGATVREEARGSGRISRSRTWADGARVERVADGGVIEDQDVEAGP